MTSHIVENMTSGPIGARIMTKLSAPMKR